MSRLIDANKLILHLNDYALVESPSDNESTEERRISEMVYKVIQNCIKAVEEQPTAYDVEKVVEETEDYLNGWVTIDASEKISEIIRKGGAE